MKQEEPIDSYLLHLREKFGKVLRYKKSYPNSRGEFKLDLELEGDKYLFHNCEYQGNGDFMVHTSSSTTKAIFEAALAEED